MSKIHELIKEYEEEGCDFSDVDWVVRAGKRLSKYHPISQVDCLMYVMANLIEEYRDEIAEYKHALYLNHHYAEQLENELEQYRNGQ